MAGASVVATGRWNGGNLRRGAEQDLNYLQRQANGFSKSVMGSFTGIGASLGAIFAAGAIVDFFKDSAQAAMEDQKSMVALAKAMDNVGLSAQNAKAESLIQSMSMQVGIADDELRPAYQKLVTVTKDVGEAQGLLRTALDLSAAGYGNLESATKALSAAANGNFTALQRLKVPIDQNIIASKDFDGAIQALNRTVGGQAAAASQTYAGQLARLSVAAGEAKEAIGYALLNSLNDLVNAIGGTGGVQQAILDLGNYIAGIITDFGKLSSAVATMADGINDFGNNLGYTGKIAEVFGNIVKYLLQPGLATLGQTVERLGIIWNAMPDWMRNALNATMGWTAGVRIADAAGKNLTTQANKLSLEHEHLARAATNAQPALAGLADETQNAGEEAWYASKSYLAFWESIYNAGRAARDFANTSSTVSSGIAQGVATGGVPEYWQKIQQQYGETAKQARSAAGGTKELSKAQEDAKQSSQDLSQEVDSLATSLQGLATDVAGGPVIDLLNPTFEAINSLVEKFKSSLAEARSYAQGIAEGLMGQLDIGKVAEDFAAGREKVKAAYDDLVEYQNKISDNATESERKRLAELQSIYDDAVAAAEKNGSSLIEAFVRQGDKVIEFGRKMNALLQAGLSKAAFDDIMKLGYERGTEVANALSDGNVAGNIASVNKVYESVKTMAEQIAEAAADAFYQAGLEMTYNLIRAMVEALGIGGKGRKRLMNLMDELAASMNRTATIYVGVSGPGAGMAGGTVSTSEWFAATYPGVAAAPGDASFGGQDFSNIDLSGIGGLTGSFMFADGGIATSPTPGIFGEAGPEALIPLDRMGEFGGNTYQITVQAGVGDPRAIGKSVVEAITLFERSSGPVFARA